MANPDIHPASKYETQHKGSEGLAINNTYIRRSLVRVALHTTAKLFHRDGPCVPISKHKIVKTGYSVHLTEAVTMRYIAEHTSIPVPKIYCSFIHKNQAYIVMERIQGEELASAWKKLSKKSLGKILAQLKNFLKELRDLEPPPGTGVESCISSSLYDSRLPHGTPRFGPYKTIQEFHRWLRGEVEATQVGDSVTDQEADDIKTMITKQDGHWPLLVFTHCDLIGTHQGGIHPTMNLRWHVLETRLEPNSKAFSVPYWTPTPKRAENRENSQQIVGRVVIFVRLESL